MKALMSKGEGTIPLQAMRHQMFLMIKRETTAQNWSTQQPCCQRIGHHGRGRSLQVCTQVPRAIKR